MQVLQARLEDKGSVWQAQGLEGSVGLLSNERRTRKREEKKMRRRDTAATRSPSRCVRIPVRRRWAQSHARRRARAHVRAREGEGGRRREGQTPSVVVVVVAVVVAFGHRRQRSPRWPRLSSAEPRRPPRPGPGLGAGALPCARSSSSLSRRRRRGSATRSGFASDGERKVLRESEAKKVCERGQFRPNAHFSPLFRPRPGPFLQRPFRISLSVDYISACE